MSGIVGWVVGKAAGTVWSKYKWYVYGLLFTFILSGGLYIWGDYKSLKIQHQLDIKNVQTYKDAADSANEKVAKVNSDLKQLQSINNDLKDVFLKAQDEKDNLLNQLENQPSIVPGNNNVAPVKRDLTKDSLNKTVAVQTEINKISDDQFRCNELASGAKVQSFDKTNTICPNLTGGK